MFQDRRAGADALRQGAPPWAQGRPRFWNILWLIVAGVWIALSHAVLGIGSALTIIGIPFALQHFKLAQLALWPFGRDFYERP